MDWRRGLPYGVAVLLVGAVVLLWYVVVRDIGPSPYPLLLIAVLAASFYGGQGPGLLATALGLGSAVLVYAPPGDRRDLLQLAVFLILALAICWMSHERLRLLRREHAARERGEHLAAERSAMLGQMTEAIITADTAGHITFMNDAAVRLLGVDQWNGLTTRELGAAVQVRGLDGSPQVGEEPLLDRALGGEAIAAVELALQRLDGKPLVVQVNATRVTSPDGAILGTVASMRDVTAERDLEQQKAAFIAGVAHDLKNPLTSIKGTAQLLLRRAARDGVPDARAWEGVVEGLREIENSTARTVALIGEFLEAGRGRRQQASSHDARPTDLVPLVHRVVRLNQQSTDCHVIRVRAVQSNVVGVWEEVRVERIVGNLLSNAIKYSPGGGDIVVTVDRDGDGPDGHAVLTVSDHGVGIPAEDRERIFEEFHRGSNVRERIAGTGIGLAATKHLIQQYGGKISVTSEEGQGTTFIVRLALAHEACVAAQPLDSGPARPR